MRRLLLPFLLPLLVSAGITCRTANNAGYNGANNGKFVITANRGTCDVGFVRPVWYVIDAASYGAGAAFNVNLFDSEVQAVFNDANLGDKVLYTAGQEFFHPTIAISRRPGTGTLEVTTTEYLKLPPIGTRITPAYAALMPTISNRTTNHGAPAFRLSGARSNPGSDHGSADHISFRGLHFRYVTGNPDTDGNSSHIMIGGIGRGGGSAGAFVNSTNATVSPAVDGVNRVITVLDTSSFAVTTPPQRVSVGGVISNGEVYTITDVNDTLHQITLDRALTSKTVTFPYIFHIFNEDGDSVYQPDDITIQQCLFDAPLPRTVFGATYVKSDVKAFTYRDNWSFMFSPSQTFEPKHMAGSNAYGPFTMENNFYMGAMSFMHGGQHSTTNAHMQAGGTWRFNTFYLPNEYNNVGEWQYVFGDTISGFDAEMSIAGLRPNSPRLVLAGRSIAESNAAQTVNTWWTALNSGVVGQTKPSCLAGITGLGNYCYDGDPGRPGTTSCNGVNYNGDGVCWNTTLFPTTIKNAWEVKNASYQTLQYNAIIGYPPLYNGRKSLSYNVTQNSVLNFKIDSSYGGSPIDHPAMGANACYWYTDDSTFPTFTYKPGWSQDPTYGSVYDPVKAAQYASTGGWNTWPECGRSWGDHMVLKNNYFRHVWGGTQMTGFYNRTGKGVIGGDTEISGNLYAMRGFTPANWPGPTSPYPLPYYYRCISIGRNSSELPDPYTPSIDNISITNNTCYTPYAWVSDSIKAYAPVWIIGQFNVPFSNATKKWEIYTGKRVMSGNVFGRAANGIFYVTTGSFDSMANGEGEPIANIFPGTARIANGTAYWGKNIMLGSPGNSLDKTLGAYPGNSTCTSPEDCAINATVWTGCDVPGGIGNFTNQTPCAGGNTAAPAAPDYTKVFVNPEERDFRIKNGHWGQRSEQGGDLGADPNQLPMIRGLVITPTDRSVVFTYRLTEPIRNIPCVIELHTAPDLETTNWAGSTTGYAGELTQLLPSTALATIQDAAGYNIDSDAHDRNTRNGNRRTLIIGTATNLAPNAPYYYRLHCGGDMATGMFTTLPPLTSSGPQSVARIATAATTANMLVTYGTSYSRATDTISGGGTASASCTFHTSCVVTFTTTLGTLVYYRWTERNASNTALLTGKVEIVPSLGPFASQLSWITLTSADWAALTSTSWGTLIP